MNILTFFIFRSQTFLVCFKKRINPEIYLNNVYTHVTIEDINLQDFVFCKPNELAYFKKKKEERARWLLEQLCGAQHIYMQRNAPFKRVAASHAIILKNILATYASKQQFGIPLTKYADKNIFIKHIAAKQLEQIIMNEREYALSGLMALLE